ncbi:S-layer homology domain-containing protein [Oscillospiraceae bacterium OttesenSCG-928-G22]|nr:S-layer homology domain-containing protein [Oscillospiraceae bacterium OttesenSCG-928-G22]
MRKRVLTVVLALLLVAASVPSAAVAADGPDFAALEAAGVVDGDFLALPRDGAVTRGEGITCLNRLFGFYTALANEFSDSEISPYRYELTTACHAGYVSGYADGSVRPDGALTRAELAVMIHRVLALPRPMDGPVFRDAERIPAWAAEASQCVYARGILELGTEEGDFLPNRAVTRGELLAALAAMDELGLHRTRNDELLRIPSFDGYELEGRLSTPLGDAPIEKLVIYVNGSGPCTYDQLRTSGGVRFRYHDLFAEEFTSAGTAYFSYNTRGVSPSDEPPMHYAVDSEAYQQYVPRVQIRDVAAMIDALKQNARLRDATVCLLGWSEGAVVAPLAVRDAGAKADALLLAGYPNENMFDVLQWQNGGEQTLLAYTMYLGLPYDAEFITKEQYEADPYGVMESVFGNQSFEDTDKNGNSRIDADDLKDTTLLDGLLDAVERGDDAWLAEHYPVLLTSAWFSDHFSLGKTEDMLAALDLPIYIFHGEQDLNCSAKGVLDVTKRFEALGKTNLETHLFPGHNHDLNFTIWVATGEKPAGIANIVETVAGLQ